MGKTLIITEKPSVAREYASILKVSGNHNGYIENNDYVITWCVGHLVTMSYPEKYDEKYKKWNLDDLPFLPPEYKYEVISGVKDQYKIVKEQLHRADIDTVLWAGDSGREGQVIEEYVRMYGGVRKGIVEKRIWIDSQTEEEIRKGIKNAKPMSEYYKIGQAGIARAEADYDMGLNLSRALSCKYGSSFNNQIKSDKWKPITVGRVMTCVLGMVVNRENEIRNFVPTPFYKIMSDIEVNGTTITGEWRVSDNSPMANHPQLYKNNGFKDQNIANQFIASLPNMLQIKDITKTVEKKNAPTLFNLAELQAECSKKFKISPDETLAVTQSLYEKKLVTYPRTDARVLSSAVAKEIDRNIAGLKNFNNTYARFSTTILNNGWYKSIEKSKYTDDSKVTDHYAIIPTGDVSMVNQLSSQELLVYETIVKRFLSIFYPPAEYNKISVEETAGIETFVVSVKTLKSPGYLEIVGIPSEDTGKKELADALALLSKGSSYNTKYRTEKGETTPPKRYDSGSIILAMENAGNLIEDEELRAQIKGSGIGTSATRAEILKKLISIGYLCLNKKTQIITPHEDGEAVYAIVNSTMPNLLSPTMTASWEKGLEQIEKGQITKADYKKVLNNFVIKQVDKIKNANVPTSGAGGSASTEVIGACPLCGKDVLLHPRKYYGCSGYSAGDANSCRFYIGTIAGKFLPKAQVEKLLKNGVTDDIKGFKSKTGKPFDAALEWNKAEKQIKFKFPEVKVEKSNLQCPKCNNNLDKREYNYSCSCGYKISHTIAKKKLSETEMKDLIAGRTQKLDGFISKKGKKFSATLVSDADGNVTFELN